MADLDVDFSFRSASLDKKRLRIYPSSDACSTQVGLQFSYEDDRFSTQVRLRAPKSLNSIVDNIIKKKDRSTLQHLADASPVLGRHLVRRLINEGHEVKMMINSNVVPIRSLRHPDHLRFSIFSKRILVDPLNIQLLWCSQRARLFACDCAKRSLQRFASVCNNFPSCSGRCLNDPRPSEALRVAYDFSFGRADLEDLHQARSAAWDATGQAWEAVWDAWIIAKSKKSEKTAMSCEHVAVGIEACEGAVRENPSEAARCSAASAIGSARGDFSEEVTWQNERLLSYLLGEMDGPLMS